MIEIVQGTIDALSLGGVYALTALGIALIFGILRLVNLAHGELIMLAGYAVFFVSAKAPLGLLIASAVVAATWVALAMERIAFRSMRSASPATLMVASFGVSYFLQNLAVVLMGSQSKAVGLTGLLSESLALGPFRVAKLDIVTIATTLILLALLATFLRYTSLGLKMRAAAENFRMARLLGVRANSVIATAFVISGGLAGIVAILLVARTGAVSPTMGVTPLIVGIVAVVIGGMESLSGAVLGGLILGFLTTGLQVFLPLSLQPFRDAVLFTAVIAFLLLRPSGLLGWKEARV